MLPRARARSARSRSSSSSAPARERKKPRRAGPQENLYFQRIRFDLADLVVGAANTAVLERAIADLAKRYGMQWRLFYDSRARRAARARAPALLHRGVCLQGLGVPLTGSW